MARICTKCNNEVVNERAKFCPNCGNELKKLLSCSSCNTENIPAEAKFCPQCGASMIQKKEVQEKPVTAAQKDQPISTCGSCVHILGKEAVDLGLSVLWSTCNVGASSVLYNGLDFSWGDPLRQTITSKLSFWFKAPPRIANICGHPEYDMAREHWGGSWRLPTCEQCIELLEECSWKEVSYKGMSFYQVKSYRNGNYILMPLSCKLWIGDRALGGSVHYLDTSSQAIKSIYYDVEYTYYVRPVTSKM